MLPSKNRLPGHRFPAVLKSLSLGGDSFFSVRVSPSDQGQPRFGLIVSKKVAAKAVDRNKIKRLLSEAILANLNLFTFGQEMIFIAKPEAARASHQDLLEEVKKVAQKIHEKTSLKTN